MFAAIKAGAAGYLLKDASIRDENALLGFTSASIKAVRCDGNLEKCTDLDDGRTYISWSEIQGELEQEPEPFIHKVRVAEPGSTEFRTH